MCRPHIWTPGPRRLNGKKPPVKPGIGQSCFQRSCWGGVVSYDNYRALYPTVISSWHHSIYRTSLGSFPTKDGKFQTPRTSLHIGSRLYQAFFFFFLPLAACLVIKQSGSPIGWWIHGLRLDPEVPLPGLAAGRYLEPLFQLLNHVSNVSKSLVYPLAEISLPQVRSADYCL